MRAATIRGVASIRINTVDLFYRPPSSPYDIFDRLQSCLLDFNVSTLLIRCG